MQTNKDILTEEQQQYCMAENPFSDREFCQGYEEWLNEQARNNAKS